MLFIDALPCPFQLIAEKGKAIFLRIALSFQLIAEKGKACGGALH